MKIVRLHNDRSEDRKQRRERRLRGTDVPPEGERGSRIGLMHTRQGAEGGEGGAHEIVVNTR